MLCKKFIKNEEISDYPLYDYAQPPDLFTVLEFLLNPKRINFHANVANVPMILILLFGIFI